MGISNTKLGVIERSELLEQDLLDLFTGKTLMLRIYPFVNEMTCMQWRLPLEKSTELGRYSNALDVSVNRIGMTLFETENDEEKMKDYFASALAL